MVKFLKDFWIVISGYVMYVLSSILDYLELVDLQKAFYLLSNALLILGILQVLSKRRKTRLIDKVVQLERTNNLVHFADNPEHKGELVIMAIQAIKKGGNKMKQFLESRGWLQWVSLVLTILLLAVGVASTFVPGLSAVGENLEAYLVLLGIVSSPGILARGKLIGETVKTVLPKKERKEILQLIKDYEKRKEELKKKYHDIIEIVRDVKELGGALTPEQQTVYNTFSTQTNALELKIQEAKNRLEHPDLP